MKEIKERELLLLAYLEGELSGEEKAKAEAMMAEDMAMQHEYRQIKNTVLQPETAIEYPNKNKLKRAVAKEKAPLGYILWPIAIAASFALLILAYSPQNPAVLTNGSVATIAPPTNNTAEENGNNAIKNNTIGAKSESSEKVVENTRVQPANGAKAIDGDFSNKSKSITQTADKALLMAPMLAVLPVVPPMVEKPQLNIVNTGTILLPPMPIYSSNTEDEKKGWLTKSGEKINVWLAYLQKPQLSIDKQENETGKEYWAITLETEKYEVEGRLYTSR